MNVLIMLVMLLIQDPDPVKTTLLLSQDRVRPGDTVKAAVEFDIAHPFHIYDAKPQGETATPTAVKIPGIAGLTFSKITYPTPIEKTIMGEKIQLYEGKVYAFFTMRIAADAAPGDRELKVLVTYGPCTDDGCLTPVHDESITLKITVAPSGSAIRETHATIFANYQAEETTPGGGTDDFASIVAQGLLAALAFAFFGGLASCLTPCVYPMMPITVSFFMSQANESRVKVFLMATIYVMGIAVTYSALGVIAALSGSAFGQFLGDRIVVTVIALILTLLGLSMFGLYEFRLPSFLTGGLSSAKRGYVGALVMGLLLGIVAAPCLGPILLSILTYISTTGDVLFGLLVMFTYAIGLGVPFFVLAVAPGILPRSGAWMTVVKVVFGVVIFGIALYFISSVYPLFIVSFIAGILLVIFVAYLWHHWRKGDLAGRIARAIVAPTLALSLLGGLFFTGGLAWEGASGHSVPVEIIARALGMEGKLADVATIERKIAEAKAARKPIMLDFWANWCIPCKEIDGLLTRDEFRKELERFAVIKVDVTLLGGETERFMREVYGFKGVPALAFHASDGTMRKDLTLNDYKSVEQRLLEVLRSIR